MYSLDGLYYHTTYNYTYYLLGQDTARNYNALISATVHHYLFVLIDYTETKCVSESCLRTKDDQVLIHCPLPEATCIATAVTKTKKGKDTQR
jgi:hypothetical protein